MDEKNMEIAVSVDYALIAAISSLAAGLSKVKGFDLSLATNTIDQYIKNPVNPDIPDRTVYEQVLETVRFQILHPIDSGKGVNHPVHRSDVVVQLFRSDEEKE
jgi:hypothetical protein